MHSNTTSSKVLNAIRVGLATVLGLSALVAVWAYVFAPEVLEDMAVRAGFSRPALARVQLEDSSAPEQAEDEVVADGALTSAASHARR